MVRTSGFSHNEEGRFKKKNSQDPFFFTSLFEVPLKNRKAFRNSVEDLGGYTVSSIFTSPPDLKLDGLLFHDQIILGPF